MVEYNDLKYTFEVGYEAFGRALAADGLCGCGADGHGVAFFIRLAGTIAVDRPVFGRERVHVGAYEATVLAYAPVRCGATLFLW